MTPLNYNHLYYFYRVALDGGVTLASRNLHLTPQTISGQISALERQIGFPLFERQGKKLELTPRGRLVMNYAEDIFHLGDELQAYIKQADLPERLSISVGVVDVIPKTLAFSLIKPVYELDRPVQLISREGPQEQLLAQLALNRLDLILSDRPLPPSARLKAYNHPIIESPVSLFTHASLARRLQGDFPHLLHGAPFLMPGNQTMLYQLLLSWFDRHDIRPDIIGEFDDSALANAFGQAGLGIFAAPSVVAKEIMRQFDLICLGQLDEFREQYFAITPQKKIKHPGVIAIVEAYKSLSATA